MQKKIAITLGEPAGIGAELVHQLAVKQQLNDCIIIGDKSLLPDLPNLPNNIQVKHIPTKEPVQLGTLNVKKDWQAK